MGHVLKATGFSTSNANKPAGARTVSQPIVSSPPSVPVGQRCVQGRQNRLKAFPPGDGGEAVRPQGVEAHLASEKNQVWLVR